jgi:dTDP-4-amino-4,6-dideoxygalactose transaminase
MIPIFDTNRKIQRFRNEIDTAIAKVLNSGNLILGENVREFEGNFSDYLGVSHCISVANGTDALEIALRSLGADPKTKIALAANAGNYARTAINIIGAIPFYLDVDFRTRNLTFEGIKEIKDLGISILIVTHLYGSAISEINEISEYCKQNSILLIEDCAQAAGATVRGEKVGSFGNLGCFSFYPTKNLGALGDGGAIITNDPEIGRKLISLRTYGWGEKYSVIQKGGRNSRLDELQAACLNVFLPHLDSDNERRRNIAKSFNQSIQGNDVVGPIINNQEYSGHLYVISCQNRDDVHSYFNSHGVSTAIHYPISDYNQPYSFESNKPIALTATDALTRTILTLPCFPELLEEEVQTICSVIASVK